MAITAAPTERFHRSVLPLVMTDLAGVVEHVNDAACELVGRPGATLLGQPLGRWCTDEAGAHAWQEALERAVEGAEGGECTVSLARPSGEVRTCRLAWSAMVGADGAPTYLSLALIDESDRVRAQEQLREQEARWRAFMRSTSDALWTADSEGRLTDVPSPLPRWSGWESHGILGRPAADFVHPDDREAFTRALDSVLSRTVRQADVECRVQGPEGEAYWVRETLIDLRDDPAIGAVAGIVTDISGLRREQRAARRAEATHRARFHGSRLPQAVADLEGRITDVNDALCELLGTTRNGLLGLPVLDLVHPSDPGDPVLDVVDIMSGRTDVARVERTVVGPAGRPLHVVVDLTLLRDELDEPAAVNAYVRDQTGLRESEARRRRQEDFHTALEALSRAMSMIADDTGQIVYVSPSVQALLGLSAQDLQQGAGLARLHPDDLPLAMAAFTAVLEGDGPRTFVARATDRAGKWHHLEHRLTDMRGSPVGGVAVSLMDVTEQMEAQLALQASEQRFRAIAEHATEGIWTVGMDGTALFANERTAHLLGLELDDLMGGDVPAEVLELQRRIAECAATARRGLEVEYLHPDGRHRCFELTCGPLPAADGTLDGALALVADVTRAREAEAELRHQALHDRLTGLPNRALLLDRLERTVTQSEGSSAVLLLGLDRFQQVNDTVGHTFGDAVLVATGQALSSAVRPQDTVARLDGDKFVVVCENTGQQQAVETAHDLLAALLAVDAVDGRSVHLQAGVGVAVGPAAAEDLLRHADTALHAAKAQGAGAVTVFEPILATRTQERYEVAAGLRSALDDGALELHYQPVVDLTSGRTLGVEALARWERPGRGPVSPSFFVPVAESHGLAGDLDRYVVRRAVADTERMRAEGVLPRDAYVAVNLCVANLRDARFADDFRAIVAASSLTPRDVVLEITEGAVMGDPEATVRLLAALRDEGYRISVDDFGTGYSSLAYLRDLPVSAVKVDRSFVTDLEHSQDARAIAGSIVQLGRAVGLAVVAEGIEDAAQLRLLREMGCTAGQGWWWCPARPVAELAGMGLVGTPFDVAPDESPEGAPKEPAVPTVERRHGLDQLRALHAAGASPSTIASALNREHFRTPNGLRWHAASVARAVLNLPGGP